jgi:hypothetical protein
VALVLMELETSTRMAVRAVAVEWKLVEHLVLVFRRKETMVGLE